MRIKNDLRQTITTHNNAAKLIERAVQAVYKMKDLAMKLEEEGGDDVIMNRLLTIDRARGILSSITVDADGEDYDFKSISFAGVKDVIDSTCNMLSALSNIPQTVLFGRSPAGENSTGDSDLENWYSYVGRSQKLMIKDNMTSALEVIVLSGLANGKLDEVPEINLTFNPLWSLTEEEQADMESKRASTQQTRAQTAQIYYDIGALEDKEIRKALAADEDFMVEDILDDVDDDDLWGGEGYEGWESEPPEEAIAEQENLNNGKITQLTDEFERIKSDLKERASNPIKPTADSSGVAKTLRDDGNTQYDPPMGVGVLVIKDGKVLCAERSDNDMICGPGGHIDPGENAMSAAVRETCEEFGIVPTHIKLIGQCEGLDDRYGRPAVYLCTEYDGILRCDNDEMRNPRFLSLDNLSGLNMFPPFRESLKLLKSQGVTGDTNLTNDGENGKIDADENWITMNGAPVLINGELPTLGAGIVLFRETADYDRLSKNINSLMDKGVVEKSFGKVMKSEPIKILSVNKHGLRHGITEAQAQDFIDNSLVMFDQGNRHLYFSPEGNSVVLDDSGRLICAYGKSDFDEAVEAILGALKNEWNLQMSDD